LTNGHRCATQVQMLLCGLGRLQRWTQVAISSRQPGLERLFAMLTARYGLDDQGSVSIALDHFLDFTRGHLSPGLCERVCGAM
jgi:hypothetical protein